MGDVGLAIQRAEDKTATMQARGDAIDELLSSGALEDPTGTTKDNLTRELEQLASGNEVEGQLAALKAELEGAPNVRSIDSAKPSAIEQQNG
jgi:phage shock protein A